MDDPNIKDDPAFRLARGMALVQLSRRTEAVAALDVPQLQGVAPACLWRMRALSEDGHYEAALAQAQCGMPALRKLSASDRPAFILPLTQAAAATGRYGFASSWLRLLPDGLMAANLVRAQARLAQGHSADGLALLSRVEKLGREPERREAQLTRLEWSLGHGWASAAKVSNEAETLSYAWRGDNIELGALQLRHDIASKQGNLSVAFAAGATMARYFSWKQLKPGMVDDMRRQLAAVLDPSSGVPLDEAAGLYWDFRDLAPVGAEGELLASRFADRLEDAGLYKRAADLLEHRLAAHPKDVSNGSLSVRVAALWLRADRPAKAITALKATEGPAWLPEIQAARQQLQGVALARLGRTAEALALLDSVPGNAGLAAEIVWNSRNWAEFIERQAAILPRRGALTAADRLALVRLAIALTMQRRFHDLAVLRTRYLPLLSGAAEQPAFNVMTGPVEQMNPAAVDGAMKVAVKKVEAGPYDALLTP